MPASFLPAVYRTLDREGFFVDHAADPGGATKYGISLRLLRKLGEDIDKDGDVDADDIRALSVDHAKLIYRRVFWLDQYNFLSQSLANKLFDTGVNMGSNRAIRIAQKACNVFGNDLSVDGILGPVTMGAFIELCERNALAFMGAIQNEQAKAYLAIVSSSPIRLAFLHGWMRRAFDTV